MTNEENILSFGATKKTKDMNTKNLEKINNLLDYVYNELCQMEQNTSTKFAKSAIELAVEKIQEIEKEENNKKNKQ